MFAWGRGGGGGWVVNKSTYYFVLSRSEVEMVVTADILS